MPMRGAWILVAALLAGCFDNTYVKEDRTDRRPKVLKVTSHVGGTHDCVLVRDRIWYAGFGPQLLVIEGRGVKDARAEPAGELGRTGPVCDLVMWRGDLIGVVRRDGVLRWDMAVPRQPMLIDHVPSKALGIRPHGLSVVGDDLFIWGEGGVVRAGDGKRFLPEAALAGPVVATAQGVVAVVGRRLERIEDGRFVGAASDIVPLPKGLGLDGGFAFMLQAPNGATVGLMGPDLRERTAEVMKGAFNRIRVHGDRLWILGDAEMASWAIREGRMEDAVFARIKGIRDIAPLSDNLYAAVGSFGRALYRLKEDREGPGDEFLSPQREPGRLDRSIFDGRRVLAGSVEGFWFYPIRGKASISDKSVELTQLPETKAALAWGTATVAKGDGKADTPDEMREVLIEGPMGKARWSPPNRGWVSTVVSVDGDLWIGHSEGITVLRKGAVSAEAEDDKAPASLVLDEVGFVRIPGPVIWLHPLRTGGGVAFVSRFGGMGVAELVPDEAAPRLAPES
jgi:hypothetical protein